LRKTIFSATDMILIAFSRGSIYSRRHQSYICLERPGSGLYNEANKMIGRKK